jgi:hypothetical protein
MYDPYVAIGGHQPSNFDRLMAIYARYTVVACDVKLSYFNNNSSSGIPQAYGMLASLTGNYITSSTTAQDLFEQPPWMVKYAEINSGIVNGPSAGLLTQHYEIGKYFGGRSRREVELHQDLSGSIAANPATQLFLEVFVASLLGNTPSANSDQYKLELTFEAIFSEPMPTLPS